MPMHKGACNSSMGDCHNFIQPSRACHGTGVQSVQLPGPLQVAFAQYADFHIQVNLYVTLFDACMGSLLYKFMRSSCGLRSIHACQVS